MDPKLLITLCENDIAPRFDLATEVVICSIGSDGSTENTRTIVLAHASAEDLCQMILEDGVDVVICNGIEEQFYDYLTWKGVTVLDTVMGPWERALERFRLYRLKPGDILFDRPEKKHHG